MTYDGVIPAFAGMTFFIYGYLFLVFNYSMIQSHDISVPRLIVSGLRGGSGKTILSLCLITLLRSKGYKVTTFKKGPDYIDAGWLAKAAGSPCYNLDLFMMTPEQALWSFISHTSLHEDENLEVSFPRRRESRKSDWIPDQVRNDKNDGTPFSQRIALIEGNRGLFDGMDHEGTYSTAELAKLLGAPVILIIDCTKATSTIAAMVLGCQKMDSRVQIGGVVLNNIATARQEAVIRKAIEEKCSLPVVGAMPRLKKDPFPERHMGLTPFQEHLDVEKSLKDVAEIGEKYIDIDAVLRIANQATPIRQGQEPMVKDQEKAWLNHTLTTCHLPLATLLKIGIIRDSAFQFYYQENFEELEKRGVELIEVSPLRETELPEIDALYIGGGFPETHAIALADNISFRNSLLDAIQRGLPVYAECGGLMYLGKSLILENKTYPMVGVFPIVFGLEKKPQAHGYTIVEVEKINPYFSHKTILRGHEFHYSKVLEIGEYNCSPNVSEGRQKEFSGQIYMAFNVKRGKGIVDGKDGICYKNVFASYTHLHAIGAPEWSDGMVRCAMKFKDDSKRL